LCPSCPKTVATLPAPGRSASDSGFFSTAGTTHCRIGGLDMFSAFAALE
jgi:hypothetical protein